MSIEQRVKDFAQIGVDETAPRRNSIALTDAEDRTIDFAKRSAEKIFQQYGKNPSDYTITTDAFGNLFITLLGKDRSQTVMSGSHADSVKNGGMYDGPVGVAAAMEFLEKLLQSGQEPARNYTVVVFRSEESSPTTGFACLGSAIATGQITEQKLQNLKYNKMDGSSVLLSEHFSERYGAERWSAVLDELKSPPINPQTVSHYEEVHIEQSNVTDLNNADVGIVAEGIGGSRRESVQVPATDIRSEEIISTKKNPYDQISLLITGRADHTGGAPHNFTDVTVGSKAISYRHNALLGAVHIIESMAAPYYSAQAKVLSISVPALTGFTTVPAIQQIELMVPSKKRVLAKQRLAKIKTELQQQGLQLSFKSKPIAEGIAVRSLDTTQVIAATKIPTAVEENAWAAIVTSQFDAKLKIKLPDANPIGKVRATVTDFRMSPEQGLSFNIDQRNVDPEQAKKLAAKIDAELERYLVMMGIEKKAVHTVISDIAYAPIDRQSVEIKRELAKIFGLHVVVMPSMPGHDAGNISKSNIPTSMTFVRHDGVSHNPAEQADALSIENAAKISHGLLSKLLDVELKAA